MDDDEWDECGVPLPLDPIARTDGGYPTGLIVSEPSIADATSWTRQLPLHHKFETSPCTSGPVDAQNPIASHPNLPPGSAMGTDLTKFAVAAVARPDGVFQHSCSPETISSPSRALPSAQSRDLQAFLESLQDYEAARDSASRLVASLSEWRDAGPQCVTPKESRRTFGLILPANLRSNAETMALSVAKVVKAATATGQWGEKRSDPRHWNQSCVYRSDSREMCEQLQALTWDTDRSNDIGQSWTTDFCYGGNELIDELNVVLALSARLGLVAGATSKHGMQCPSEVLTELDWLTRACAALAVMDGGDVSEAAEV